MSITKLHNGALQFTDIVNGYLFTRTYYGYNRREATALFKQDIKED